MKLSHSWLQKYIAFDFTPEELSEKLTMLGLEVESFERLGDKYTGFVVGKVLEATKHPNADKLTVCSVDVGKERLQIVCGAPNVSVGQKVAVGLPGAVVPRNQHDPKGGPFVLSRVSIRGVESHGMICSEYELDLGPDKDGILVLDGKARVGQALARYLGLDDIVYEIGITPNRPDLLSHFGVAREIGILTGKTPKLPAVRLRESKVPIGKSFSVRVEDTVNCPRFAVRLIRGVRISESPLWMQRALQSVGLRPRNNVVDVTNYVMLECGQPMHAFDLAMLRGNRIIVRQARGGTRFTTLDGKERILPEGAVMVCDAEREVSIAGIMGGENSEISDATTDVVLESAYWNPSSIRRTAKALGIQSDASYRFERGADPNASDYALDRAASLIVELAGGQVLKGKIDIYPKKIQPRRISLRPERCNSVLGTRLSSAEIEKFLSCLGIRKIAAKKERVIFQVPTFRVDIEREIDLIEEVARVYGYDNIETKTVASIDLDHPFKKESLTDRIREILVGFGYHEALTISLQDERTALLANPHPVRLANPLGVEMSTMRTSLVPGLLQAVARNHSFGNVDLRMFEIGHVFSRSAEPQVVDNIKEEQRVCLLLTGLFEPRHWKHPASPADIYHLKGEVADLLQACDLDSWRYIYYSTSETLADNPIFVEINGATAGYLGRVRQQVREAFGVEHDVWVAELNVELLSSRKAKWYVPLPRFPKARRDVAFVVDVSVTAESIEQCMREAGTELLQEIEVFDVYRGPNLPPGKKSIAYTLQIMSRERTLTDEEIDAEVERVVQRVCQRFGATLRTG
ncbi:MAG TPA: phenylalanine--tRNA ligase subunit beta [Bacteroidota bacterium]|nr:phenylalanine--tRNA ligase subunit beta [Bacteroidota bacterium]